MSNRREVDALDAQISFYKLIRLIWDSILRTARESSPEKKKFCIIRFVKLHALISIGVKTAMGVSVNAQTNAESDYVKAIKTIVEVLHKRMFNILYRYDLSYRFTTLARREKQALAIIHGFSESVIIQRRAELLKSTPTESKQAKENLIDSVDSKKRMAFLDILLQSETDGKPLSNLDIREEVDTFMFEGHDTTSSALNFCFYNLALNPECQQKCVIEILEILGEDPFKPAHIESLNKLQYLEMCIKETLRLFPAVPLFGRDITEEFVLNGKTIPAGANVGISPFLMGRRADLYPDPLHFNPERFRLGHDATKLNPYAYIPFAAGPRNCIGQKFAMLEMKVTLANALRRYEFEWVGNREEQLKLIAELILRPNQPLMFKIKPRF